MLAIRVKSECILELSIYSLFTLTVWSQAVMRMPTQSRMLECPYSTTTEERVRGKISHAVPVLRMLGFSVAH